MDEMLLFNLSLASDVALIHSSFAMLMLVVSPCSRTICHTMLILISTNTFEGHSKRISNTLLASGLCSIFVALATLVLAIRHKFLMHGACIASLIIVISF